VILMSDCLLESNPESLMYSENVTRRRKTNGTPPEQATTHRSYKDI
jgi:hypothetical protein